MLLYSRNCLSIIVYTSTGKKTNEFPTNAHLYLIFDLTSIWQWHACILSQGITVSTSRVFINRVINRDQLKFWIFQTPTKPAILPWYPWNNCHTGDQPSCLGQYWANIGQYWKFWGGLTEFKIWSHWFIAHYVSKLAGFHISRWGLRLGVLCRRAFSQWWKVTMAVVACQTYPDSLTERTKFLLYPS